MNSGLFGSYRGTELSNLPLSRFRNTDDYLGAYASVASVYTCVNTIANAIAGLPMHFTDPAGKALFTLGQHEAKEGSLAYMLENPNEYQTNYELMETTAAHLELTGNSLWLLENVDGQGRPERIYPLNPAFIKLYIDPQEGLLGYLYEMGSARMVLDKSDVLHFRYANPLSLFWGMGTLAALSANLDLEININDAERALYQNGAVIPGAFVSKEMLSKTQFERLKDQMQQDHSGVANFFKPLVLDGGMDWKAMTVGHTDLGTLPLKQYNREEIYMAFGVPGSQAGHQGRANVKNDHLTEVFWTTTIAPKIRRIKGTLKKLARAYDERVGIDFQIPVNVALTELLSDASLIDVMTSISNSEKRTAIKTIVGEHIGLANMPKEKPVEAADEAPAPPAGLPAPDTNRVQDFATLSAAKAEDTTATTSQHTGVMVAFPVAPDVAKVLAAAVKKAGLPDTAMLTPAAEMHLTLAYLGDSGDLTPNQRIVIERVVADFAWQEEPMAAVISGVGRFNTTEEGGNAALYASVDAPDLPEFRQELATALEEMGIEIDDTHGFTPHITLAYLPAGAPMPQIDLPPALELQFDSLLLAWAGEHTTYQLEDAEGDEVEDPGEGEEVTALAVKGSAMLGQLTEGQKAAAWQVFDAKAACIETGFERALAAVFEEQKQAALEELGAKAFGFTATGVAWVEKFADAARPFIEKALTSGRELATSRVAAAEAHVKEAAARAQEMAQQITATTEKAIKSAIAKGAAPVDAITAVFETALGSRAALIATSETVAAINFAKRDGYDALGYKRLVWVSQRDKRVRPSHRAADGQENVNGLFTVGGAKMLYPGDSNAPARETSRCRCTVVPAGSED